MIEQIQVLGKKGMGLIPHATKLTNNFILCNRTHQESFIHLCAKSVCIGMSVS